jgi:hypothetical protein
MRDEMRQGLKNLQSAIASNDFKHAGIISAELERMKVKETDSGFIVSLQFDFEVDATSKAVALEKARDEFKEWLDANRDSLTPSKTTARRV